MHIFERDSLLIKKSIVITFIHHLFGFVFDNNISNYVIFAKEDYYLRRIIFDDDLNFISDTKAFQNCINTNQTFGINIKVVNNTIIVVNSNEYFDAFNQTSMQTSIHKMTLDFESRSCESTISAANQDYASSFGEDITSSALQSTDKVVTFAYIKEWQYNTSSPNNNVTDFITIDLKQCVWPRYPPYPQQCSYPIPSFNLMDNIVIPIGYNNQTDANFIPFKSCKNENFIMRIFDVTNTRTNTSYDNTNITPDWIQIHNSSHTISFLKSNIKSVGSYFLSFQAQLISYTFPYNYYQFSTPVYQVKVDFTNENCNFVKVDSLKYLIVDKMVSLNISFSDPEDDIILTSGQNQYISFMISLNQTSLSGTLFLQASTTSSKPVALLISYTDSYHKELSLWKNFTLTYNIFASEPPVFVTNLEDIKLDRCHSKTIQLPQLNDPDTPNSIDGIVVSLSTNTPSWIKLNKDYSILFDTTDLNAKIDYETQVEITLADISNAFTTYSFNVIVDPLVRFTFPQIEDINLDCPISTLVPIKLRSDVDTELVNCETDIKVNSVKFYKEASSLQIDIQNYKECKSLCAKLRSINSCGNPIYSNEFSINFNAGYPPVATNSFGPLVINKGISKLFQIPPDLFTSLQNNRIEYQANNCIDIIAKNTQIQVVKHNASNNGQTTSSFYLSILSFDSFNSCKFPIIASDIFGNSAEYLTQLSIIVCSSKDCAECSGPYQVDCIRCKDGFALESSGVCVQNTIDKNKSIKVDIYGILGICSVIIIIINVALIFKLKEASLYPFKYAQPILVFIVSIEAPSSNMISFTRWLQWTKLNCGFIYLFDIKEHLYCNEMSERMINSQLYCQNTIQNYSFIIVGAIIFILTLALLRKWVYQFNKIFIISNEIYCYISNSYPLRIFIINSFFPFFVSNIMKDFINYSDHKVLSLLSAILLLIVLCFIFINYNNTNSLQNSNTRQCLMHSRFSIYFCSIRSILLSCLFVFSTKSTYLIWGLTYIISQVITIVIQLLDNRAKDKETSKHERIRLLTNVQLTVVLCLILLSHSQSILTIDITICTMILEIFAFLLIYESNKIIFLTLTY